MPRHSGTILVTDGHGPGLEVLLVERAPELRFFGGYWALPGGVRGPEDGDDERGDDRPPLRRCAVRELFEETGILLGGRRVPEADRAAVRRAMLEHRQADGDGTSPWTELGGPDGGTGSVRDICRITTPPFAPVRYDTLFVRAEMPRGERLDLWPGELVDARFVRPAAALTQWRRGEMALVPPLVILLEHLVDADGDLDRFHRAILATTESYQRGRLHRVRFSPGICLASVRSPTLPPATTTNCYLVGTERLIIVDPATPWPDEQQRLCRLIDELHAEGAVPEAILVTHHHPDHVGAVAAVSQRYDLPVHAHHLTLDRLPSGFCRGRSLADGDRVALGRAPDGTPDWELVAVHTPGHDRGHLCFRDTRYGTVLVGDMLSTVSTIVIDPPEGHLKTYLASLARLQEDPMTTLYPAHGPAMRDGHRLVQQYVRHRAQREHKLLEVLRQAPDDADGLLPKVYWDVDRRMLPIAARSLRAGLDKLVEDGLVERTADGLWRAREP